MPTTNQKDFNDFLRDNALWMCLIIVGVILVVLFIVFLIAMHCRKNKAKQVTKRAINVTAYMKALGGAENIISHSLVRSRIILELKDYDLVNKEELKKAGVDGFIMMSNKLTLVIQGDAELVNKAIFGE